MVTGCVCRLNRRLARSWRYVQPRPVWGRSRQCQAGHTEKILTHIRISSDTSDVIIALPRKAVNAVNL